MSSSALYTLLLVCFLQRRARTDSTKSMDCELGKSRTENVSKCKRATILVLTENDRYARESGDTSPPPREAVRLTASYGGRVPCSNSIHLFLLLLPLHSHWTQALARVIDNLYHKPFGQHFTESSRLLAVGTCLFTAFTFTSAHEIALQIRQVFANTQAAVTC